MDEKFKRKIMEDVGLEKRRIGWTHPLFLAILVLSFLALCLVIWVNPADAQSDMTWQDPYGWEFTENYYAEYEMQKYYDLKNKWAYGDSRPIWETALDLGYWKHWNFIDGVGHKYYWGFNISVSDGHYLTWGSESQIEVLVETYDGKEVTYKSTGWIISRGEGYTTWLGGLHSPYAVKIQNGAYDGRGDCTRVMVRFRWEERPRRILSYRVRGVHFE